jgi:hypothetical protein
MNGEKISDPETWEEFIADSNRAKLALDELVAQDIIRSAASDEAPTPEIDSQ